MIRVGKEFDPDNFLGSYEGVAEDSLMKPEPEYLLSQFLVQRPQDRSDLPRDRGPGFADEVAVTGLVDLPNEVPIWNPVDACVCHDRQDINATFVARRERL